MTWTRRHFITTSSLAALGGALRRPLFAQQPAPTPVFQPLRRNAGFFTARGGTIGWLISPDAVIVIDSQYPETAKMCADGVKERASRQIDALVNTHHHPDHTGGNAVFRPLVKKIVAHARVPELQKAWAAAQKTETPQVYPDTTYEKTWQETVGDEVLAIKYFGPGHTGGDSVVTLQKANVVHMGDLMFNRLHPRVDRPGGASIKGWIDQLGKVPGEHDRDTIYIFGHAKAGMPVTGPQAELAVLRNYLTAVLEHAQQGIKAGKSKEEITAASELPGFTDFVAAGQILTLAGVLGAAYDELTAAG
jgi:glyoxylase-like metal-dependent hydrolase (beta-lactamase superfamily II)